MNRTYSLLLAAILVLSIVGFVVGAVIPYATFWIEHKMYRSKQINYRYEVTVETPDGPLTGHSVHNVLISNAQRHWAIGSQFDITGEAVPFELPDGRFIFATLRAGPSFGFQDMFGASMIERHPFVRWTDIVDEFDIDVPENALPLLAVIDARGEADTLRLLEGSTEFKVASARIVSTNEDVTEEVEELLPWLPEAIKVDPILTTRLPETNLARYLKLDASVLEGSRP